MTHDFIKVERTWDGKYRVVEINPDGFTVLGTYADEATARRRAKDWTRELAELN